MRSWIRWAACCGLLVCGAVAQEEEEGGVDKKASKEAAVTPEEEKIFEEPGTTNEKLDPDNWPALPVWDPADAERLKSGEIMPGEELLREITGDLRLPPPDEVEEELPPEPETAPLEEDPTLIADRYLEAYLGQRPTNYLVDPQELLTRQEYRDRESFLEYHAGDSEVNLHIYLFDAEQKLPAGVTIEGVFAEHFERSGPTALVFYFLGRPERSQMVLSGDIRKAIPAGERDRALQSAIAEAFEKTDLADQVDNFSVELSIRLYWFEKAMEMPGMAKTEGDGDPATLELRPPVTLPPSESKALKLLTNSLWAVIILVLSAALGWIGRLVARRRLRYVFPEVEVEPLLGAPHAAGVGAVISFSSAQLPPSQQRDQVPDYLQRM